MEQVFEVPEGFGAGTTLACHTNPYLNYYTFSKAYAGQIWLLKNPSKEEVSVASQVVDGVLVFGILYLVFRMKNGKIESFTDLNVWKEGHKLAIMIYEITKSFPKEETYSLIDQMKRCSISITSNIAEGFSRQGKKEKIQFYFMSKGSLTELQNQLLLARDIGFLKQKDFKIAAEQTVLVHKLINGFIRTASAKY